MTKLVNAIIAKALAEEHHADTAKAASPALADVGKPLRCAENQP